MAPAAPSGYHHTPAFQPDLTDRQFVLGGAGNGAQIRANMAALKGNPTEGEQFAHAHSRRPLRMVLLLLFVLDTVHRLLVVSTSGAICSSN